MRPDDPARHDSTTHLPRHAPREAGWDAPLPRDSADIEVEELRELLARGADVAVLDVRPAHERAEWFIPGSLHLDAYHALRAGDPLALKGVLLPAGVPVVAVCGSGRTSAIATRWLRSRGFEARSLVGGMKAWSLAWNMAELADPDVTLVQLRRTGKGCLSYLLASGSEAIVVDASIDPEIYQSLARDRGWTIRAVLDTHIHADHLSRSRTLAARAGADHFLPVQDRARFSHRRLADGDELRLGSVKLRAIRTPGHTAESTCYLVDERWLITGDTVFLAAVGRPDLEASAEEAHARALMLHGSLERLFTLDPGLLVCPGHTSQPIPFDRAIVAATLGQVRAAVHLPGDADVFARHVLQRLPPNPPNHGVIVAANEAGEWFGGDPTDLEAGANRCAVA